MLNYEVADRAGFEPAIPFQVYTLSKRAPSAARPPVRKKGRTILLALARQAPIYQSILDKFAQVVTSPNAGRSKLGAEGEQFRVGGSYPNQSPHPKCLAAEAASAFRPPRVGGGDFGARAADAEGALSGRGLGFGGSAAFLVDEVDVADVDGQGRGLAHD